MKDYRLGFKERFVREDGLLGVGKYDEEVVLAFIDEVVAEAREEERNKAWEVLYAQAVAVERAALIEEVEGMRSLLAPESGSPDDAQAVVLDDILTYLQGEECHCAKAGYDTCDRLSCDKPRSPKRTFSDFFHNASAEEKKELWKEVTRLATNDQREQIGLPPLA